MKTFELKGEKEYSVKLSYEDIELIYDALNEYSDWNDNEDDNPQSVIMNKLYNLLELYYESND
jgi:hypothetical protein